MRLVIWAAVVLVSAAVLPNEAWTIYLLVICVILGIAFGEGSLKSD